MQPLSVESHYTSVICLTRLLSQKPLQISSEFACDKRSGDPPPYPGSKPRHDPPPSMTHWPLQRNNTRYYTYRGKLQSAFKAYQGQCRTWPRQVYAFISQGLILF